MRHQSKKFSASSPSNRALFSVPTYTYVAKSLDGREKTGTMEARDKYELSHLLRDQGFLLVSAQGKDQRTRLRISIPIFGIFLNRIPLAEKMIFARYLSVMIEAGVDLNRSLAVMADQTQHKRFRAILKEVGQAVTRGTSFSEALSHYPDAFPAIMVSMVRVGEESGNLVGSLRLVALQLEKEHELLSRVRGALIYPAVVVGAMVIVGILMFMFVVPRLSEVYDELGAKLPPTTQLIIGVGKFIEQYWYTLPAIFGGAAFLLRTILRTSSGKRAFDAGLLKAPIFSGLVRKVATARTARTLSSLIEAGVSLVQALEITSDTMGNVFFRASLRSYVAVVQKGTSLADAFARDTKLWPPMIVQLSAIGEETGKLSEVLEKLAAFYEGEVEQATKNLSTLIEPLLMVVIGVSVGFFVVSMLQPMYNLVNVIE